MNIKYGSWVGNGAAVNVSLGFLPAAVLVLNETDGTHVGFYIKGMTGSIDIDVAAGPVTDAGGITEYAGDEANPAGFAVDAGNNTNAKTFRYIAFGAD